jgi:hypothetical protein
MKLEDFIKENRNAFNYEAPRDGHLERFNQRLNNNLSITNRFHYIKRLVISSAAVITLLLGIGYIFYYYTDRQFNSIEIVKQNSQQTSSHLFPEPIDTIHPLDNKKQKNEIKETTESQTNEILLSESSLPQTNEETIDMPLKPDNVEKLFICQLEQEINSLKKIIAQMSEETRIYIEQDIEQIRQTSVLPETYQILSEEEQINLITLVYTTQIESVQRIQNNFKQISLYQ